MKLNVKERLGSDICAELKSAGLTGIVFIDLDRAKHGEMLDAPPPGCRPPFPPIPSRPSKTKQIFASLDTLMSKMSSRQTDAIIKNLESATVHLDRTFRRTDQMLTEGGVDHILAGTKLTLAEARTTLKGIKTEFDALNLKETSGQAQRMLENLEKDSRKVSSDLKITVENLRQVSENLDVLVDRIQADPSQILFSSAPSPRPRRESTP